jgi:hypothetical protein
MSKEESRTNWAPGQFSLLRQSFGRNQTDLQGEYSILEMISIAAPLPDILNKLCSAIDLQIGNVVSVILLADEAEHGLQAIARGARQYGLHVFWTASISARGKNVLGSFEMCCSVPRTPTTAELQLIQRVTNLAGLAIRRHNSQEDLASFSKDWKMALRKSSHAESPLD